MNKKLATKRLVGGLSGVIGIVSVLLPIATVEIGAFGFSVSSETYNLIELLQELEEIDKKDEIMRISIGLLIFGSIVSFGSVINKHKIALIGILGQIIGVGIFLQTIVLRESESLFLSVEPEIGLYAMGSAPIIGIVVVLVSIILQSKDIY